MYFIHMPLELTDRAVIALTGPEAHPFLQGLITNDMNALTPSQAIYAALLTPQGKILFDFFVRAAGDEILLDCLATARDDFVKRLSMYKLRANVAIAPRDDLGVYSGEGPADPRLEALGERAILNRGAIESRPGTGEYHQRRLDHGVPEGADFGSGRMFALDADLDELHAISFEKGCYVGQELTARMKHRGTDRKRLLAIASTDGSALPACDIAITAGIRELGTITSIYGDRGFALIRLDRLAECAGETLEAGGVDVEVRHQNWLFT
jgi:folate-binding protein YgfZ